jgi:hypothetical protein
MAVKWEYMQELISRKIFICICLVIFLVSALHITRMNYNLITSGERVFGEPKYYSVIVLIYSSSLFFVLFAFLRISKKYWARRFIFVRVSFFTYLIYLIHTCILNELWHYLHIWSWFKEVTLFRHSLVFVLSLSLLVLFWSALMSGAYTFSSNRLRSLFARFLPSRTNISRGEV